MTPAWHTMLPEETQELTGESTFTLKPGQLAIVANQSTVIVQAVTDQLIVSWEHLPKFCILEVMQQFCEGFNTVQSLEEMLHSLHNENKFENEQWYQMVKRAVVNVATETSQALEEFEGMMESRGICPCCNRHFHLYASYCPECNVLYCIWCQFFNRHEHNMLFISNYHL